MNNNINNVNNVNNVNSVNSGVDADSNHQIDKNQGINVNNQNYNIHQNDDLLQKYHHVSSDSSDQIKSCKDSWQKLTAMIQQDFSQDSIQEEFHDLLQNYHHVPSDLSDQIKSCKNRWQELTAIIQQDQQELPKDLMQQLAVQLRYQDQIMLEQIEGIQKAVDEMHKLCREKFGIQMNTVNNMDKEGQTKEEDVTPEVNNVCANQQVPLNNNHPAQDKTDVNNNSLPEDHDE